MKNYLLTIPLLFVLSLIWVKALIIPAFHESFDKPVPRKIAPDQRQPKDFNPQKRGKYNPSQMNRMFFFEHIHRSIQRGKKGTVVYVQPV